MVVLLFEIFTQVTNTTMTTKLKWRLGKLPTPEELRGLVHDKIITQEEAREILFNKETDEERDSESLKEEIKFLRETIENLSKGNRTHTIEVIRNIIPNWNYPWTAPYVTYCGSNQYLGTTNSSVYASAQNLDTSTLTANTAALTGFLPSTLPDSSFTDINTF